MADYVRPQQGINNHVNLQGIRSMNALPMTKFRYLPHCRKYCLFFYFDLGMKIPNGIGDLDKSFNSTKPHVNP